MSLHELYFFIIFIDKENKIKNKICNRSNKEFSSPKNKINREFSFQQDSYSINWQNSHLFTCNA
jgi:hypothetical protein